jgi:hypothetical protein
MDCPIPVEMSSTASLAVSLFLGGFVGGWYLYDLFVKQKTLDDRIYDVSGHVDHLDSLQNAQSEILCEHDQRIREKKDYDEGEEVDEAVYQGWRGISSSDSGTSLSILIWREKLSTLAKNRQWADWLGQQDGACTVRDYYIGNLHPDFTWAVDEVEGALCASVRETMVNGWDSVVKLKILAYGQDDSVADRSNQTWNQILKGAIEKNTIKWSKELIPVAQAC